MNFVLLFNAKSDDNIDFTKNCDIIIMGKVGKALKCICQVSQNKLFRPHKFV